MKNGVSPQQLASAYSAFSNDGVRLESNFIRRIEDPSGKVVYNNENPTKYKVMTANVSADMTSMMLDTYGGYGTAYGAGPDYGLIAGKTGSTEVSEGNMQTRDKWMVGYTPDFTIVTWVGLDNVGDGNLDELMPTGMDSLFNIQTTNLMLSSPQTPFKVQMASQMEADSNFIDEDIFGDDFKAWLEGAGETLNKVVDRLGNEASDLWQSASEWLETVELPF